MESHDMTDLSTFLRALARRTRDAARADAAGAAALRPDYEAALAAAGRDDPPSATPEGHTRAVELHPLVVLAERDAREREAAADRLDDAAGLIEDLEDRLAAVEDQVLERDLRG